MITFFSLHQDALQRIYFYLNAENKKNFAAASKFIFRAYFTEGYVIKRLKEKFNLSEALFKDWLDIDISIRQQTNFYKFYQAVRRACQSQGFKPKTPWQIIVLSGNTLAFNNFKEKYFNNQQMSFCKEIAGFASFYDDPEVLKAFLEDYELDFSQFFSAIAQAGSLAVLRCGLNYLAKYEFNSVIRKGVNIAQASVHFFQQITENYSPAAVKICLDFILRDYFADYFKTEISRYQFLEALIDAGDQNNIQYFLLTYTLHKPLDSTLISKAKLYSHLDELPRNAIWQFLFFGILKADINLTDYCTRRLQEISGKLALGKSQVTSILSCAFASGNLAALNYCVLTLKLPLSLEVIRNNIHNISDKSTLNYCLHYLVKQDIYAFPFDKFFEEIVSRFDYDTIKNIMKFLKQCFENNEFKVLYMGKVSPSIFKTLVEKGDEDGAIKFIKDCSCIYGFGPMLSFANNNQDIVKLIIKNNQFVLLSTYYSAFLSELNTQYTSHCFFTLIGNAPCKFFENFMQESIAKFSVQAANIDSKHKDCLSFLNKWQMAIQLSLDKSTETGKNLEFLQKLIARYDGTEQKLSNILRQIFS